MRLIWNSKKRELRRSIWPGFLKSRLLMLGLIAATVAGCGGGGGGSSSGSGETSSSGGERSESSVGTFLDGRVVNVSYTLRSGGVGVTDANGQFPLQVGDRITFSIGGITLPEIEVKSTITPLDIFSTDNIRDVRVVNLLRFLQTIDEDNDPSNGIVITDSIKEVARDAIIEFDSPDFDTDVQNIINASVFSDRLLITEEEAVDHFEETLASLPPRGVYYEIYGMQEGDFRNSISGRTLIGTSDGGNVFNVSGFGRFILFVPANSSRVFVDAIRFSKPFPEDPWLASAPGEEFFHRDDGFNPYADDASCTWTGDCLLFDAENMPFITQGESFIEGQPDNYAIASTVGENSYYQFSTYGTSTMRVVLTSTPILAEAP